VTETLRTPQGEPDAAQARQEARREDQPGHDADERSGDDERRERDDRDAGSSPAW
jgi:hypothetical protein